MAPHMNFVPAHGDHIIKNTTYTAPGKDDINLQPIGATVIDYPPIWWAIFFFAMYILLGAPVWFYGLSEQDEIPIRAALTRRLRKPYFVNFVFVVLWPLILPSWSVVHMRRRTEEKRLNEFERAMARATRRPMAGAETGKCRMPLL